AMYYLELGSSASPTTANVVVTLGINKDLSAGAADYSGVWQAAPFVNPTISNGNNTSPTITFGSSVGNKAVGLLSSTAGSATANGSGQSQYWSIGGAFPCASTEKPGAISVTMTHTIASSNKWIMIGGTMQDHAVMLPIELTKFEAECNTTNYRVFWETASEKNSAYFELERSKDAENWLSVAKILSKGNSSTTSKYQYTDEIESYEAIYYRLTQYDKDGSFEKFNIIHPICKSRTLSKITLFPNPTTDNLNLRFDLPNIAGQYSLSIYSARGKCCLEDTIYPTDKKFTKSISLNLMQGIYFVIITDASGNNILKERVFVQ
ncbi:MAG: T9SS type A sorting domain-containing protein, partial [Bacteroidota bacterium]